MRAGWYDDPFHRFTQRYHDGDDWTEHVSDGSGVSFVDPSGAESFISGPPPTGPAWSGDAPRRAEDDLASPWLRLAARILDGVVIGVPMAILTTILFGEWIEVYDDGTFEYELEPLLMIVVVSAVYEVVLIALRGRTLGKAACGLTVVGAGSGAIPTWAMAVVRWLTLTALYGLPYVGIFLVIASAVLIFASPRRQTLHDMTARTIVVRRDAR